MKLEKRKKFNYSFILTIDKFNELYWFLEQYYSDIQLEISLEDWTTIHLNYKDFLEYKNYDWERIVWLWMKCFTTRNEITLDNDGFLLIEMWELSYNESICYTLISTSEDDFKKIKEWLEKIIKNNFKEYYSVITWSFKRLFLISTLSSIIIPIIFIFMSKGFWLDTVNYKENISTFYWITSLTLIILGEKSPIYIFLNFLFPKYIFWTWKQKKEIKKKEYWRNIVFVVIFLWIVVWIFVNIISRW